MQKNAQQCKTAKTIEQKTLVFRGYLKNANVQNIDLCIRASPRFSRANATSRRAI